MSFDLNYLPPNQPDENCYKHTSANADFLCLTCLEFICKHCFVNDHKDHEAKVPSEIVKEINNQVSNNTEKLQIIRKINVDIFAKEEKIKDQILLTGNNIKSELSLINSYYSKESKKFIENQQESQNEINDLIIKIDDTIRKNSDNKELLNDLNNKDKSEILQSIIKGNINILTKPKDSINLLNQITETLSNIKQKEEKESIKLEEVKSCLKKYENDIKSAADLKKTNLLYSIRRFFRFCHPQTDSIYLKRTTLKFSSSKNILLAGISLCALYKHSRDISLSIEISISKKRNNDEIDYFPIHKENILLKNSKNFSEPIIPFYFTSPIDIHEKEHYLFAIENLSNDNYISIFSGNAIDVNKFFKTQEIKCNNTSISFTFSRPKDMYSDFDEMNVGIISDIIYSSI